MERKLPRGGWPAASSYLPEAFTADPDRLARFEREAKVLASLNHPNIGSIYGLEEAEGVKALVLELVEGPTLADRIKQGPIPLDEALPIAKQIAEALEAAHEQGVIHRDLKPANIKVKDDGTVKVLDFGLAKAFQPDATAQGLSASPTISLTAAATQMGMVIGTAAYMSPEQASGKPVDKRADVWAFGVVLFEMLTGTRPFVGDDVSKTLARVIDREPDWAALPDRVPPVLNTFLRQCLQKNPKKRIRDIGDVSLAMEGAFETPVSAPAETAAAAPSQVWQRPVAAVAGALLLVAITGIVVWSLMRSTPSAPRVERFGIPPQAPETVGLRGGFQDIAISRDGSRVVYTATGGNPHQLYVRAVGELDATPLEVPNTSPYAPFISPDGATVGFFDNYGDILKKVSILGGPAVTISGIAGNLMGASWGADDTIIFGTSTLSGLRRVSSNGGEPEQLTTSGGEQGEANHAWPHILPGGRAVLFTILTGPVDNAQIALLNLDTGENRVLFPGGSAPRYSSTGHIVYGGGNSLRAVAFDLDRLVVTDPNPVPVLEGVITKGNGAANFDLARDGSLVYVAGQAGQALQRTLVWVDREGREEPLDLQTDSYSWAHVSPDGQRIAFSTSDPENEDVWVSEWTRGTLIKVTTDPETDNDPVWTPDGQQLVFPSRREDGRFGFYAKAADGTGSVEKLLMSETGGFFRPYGWSPDGRTLVFDYGGADGGGDIGMLSMEGDRPWQPLLQTEASEVSPAISPDGAWLAYVSDQTGQPEVYVERFPDTGDRRPISTGGGAEPLWSPDGRELFYRRGDAMMAVAIDTEPAFSAGNPEVLFEEPYYSGGTGLGSRRYDIAPDGQRFLMIKQASAGIGDAAGPQIILIQNWFEELKRLVPVP